MKGWNFFGHKKTNFCLSPVAKILLNLIFLGDGVGWFVEIGTMKETQWIFDGDISK